MVDDVDVAEAELRGVPVLWVQVRSQCCNGGRTGAVGAVDGITLTAEAAGTHVHTCIHACMHAEGLVLGASKTQAFDPV